MIMKQTKPSKNTPIAGTRFGDLTIIQRVADSPTTSLTLKVQVRVECVCGRRLTLPYYYLTRKQPSPKINCGECKRTLSAKYPQEYTIWSMMHVRCEDPRHIAYKYYGDRGIKVCDEWHKPTDRIPASLDGKGFERFITFIGKRPSMKYSIDRIDNDDNYQPYQTRNPTLRQVRWATAKEQRANQGHTRPAFWDKEHQDA